MDKQFIRVLLTLCEDVGTPVSKQVAMLARQGRWTELQSLRVSPLDYPDALSYRKDAACVELCRKAQIKIPGVNRAKVAFETFLDMERHNALTNARLNRFLPEAEYLLDPSEIRILDFIAEVRKEIRTVTGYIPDSLTPRFSGGATLSDLGVFTTLPDKMSSAPTLYASMIDIVEHSWWRNPNGYKGTQRHLPPLTGWAATLAEAFPERTNPRVSRSNNFFTVTKDGKTDRGCCKEASLAVSLQLDIGRLLKTRLKTWGIDLKGEHLVQRWDKVAFKLPLSTPVLGGKDLHMALACAASIHDHLATIDLSSASDTIAKVVVKLLLPQQWYDVLNSLRAPFTKADGKEYRLEKFSSMGNGFTFELETLIFSAISRCVVRELGGNPDLVRCYGDDIIVPKEAAKALLAVLRFFGFIPNESKTFLDGVFRESCGGDFWRGVNVRSHYVESPPDEPQQWISLANGIRRMGQANGEHDPLWITVRRAWFRCLDPIPSRIRGLRGPRSLGDVVIHDEPSKWLVCSPPSQKAHSYTWEGDWIEAYAPIPLVLPWKQWHPRAVLESAVLGATSRGVTPRDGVTGYCIAKIFVSPAMG